MSQREIRDYNRAENYPMLDRGVTLGTMLEHRESGYWTVVLDVKSDDDLQVLSLEDVADSDFQRFEQAEGCYEHAVIARELAEDYDDAVYVGPPELFDVLGPIHPDARQDGDS